MVGLSTSERRVKSLLAPRLSKPGTASEPAAVSNSPDNRSCFALRPGAEGGGHAGAPGTCAVLLQPPDLGMQPLESAGVLPLKEQEVLLGTVQLVLQVCGCHADIQMTCGKHGPWWLSLTMRVAGGRLEEGAACCPPSLALGQLWAA